MLNARFSATDDMQHLHRKSQGANQQGWAVDEGHSLYNSFKDGAIWDYLNARTNIPTSTEVASALSYLCVNAAAVLEAHPPQSSHANAFEFLLSSDYVSAPEDVLLRCVMALARSNEVLLRSLLSRIRLHLLPVRSVMGIEAHLSPLSLLDYYRSAALGQRTRHIRCATRVIESEHPYSPHDNASFEHVRFDGANSLTIEFDRRTNITQGAQLLLWQDRAATIPIASWSDTKRRSVRFAAAPCGELLVEFRCAYDARPAWGWKILVTETSLDGHHSGQNSQ